MVCLTLGAEQLMISPDSGRWKELNRGCALFFRDCDPRRFTTGFDRDMLDSQRNHFVSSSPTGGVDVPLAMLTRHGNPKLSQAMHAQEECFLTRPEWRGVDRAATEPSAYGSEETQLKNILSKLLMDLPAMVRESADLVKSQRTQHGRQDQQSALVDVTCRQTRTKQKIERWFSTLSLKTGPDLAATDGQPLPPHKQRYRSVFCAIVDCVVNSVLVKIDRMILCLSSLLDPTARNLLGPAFGPDFTQVMEKRRTAGREAFGFVKSTSDIGTKPLGFGLNMIATDDDVFEMALPEMRLP